MAVREFAVSVESLPGDVHMVGVRGEVDAAAAPRLEEVLLGAAEAARRVVVDLRRVDYIDSLGFTALTRTLDAVKARGGKLAVVCEPRLAGLFEVLALDTEFHVTEELDQGVKDALAQKTGSHAALGEQPWQAVLRAAREAIESGMVPPGDDELAHLRRALDELAGGEP